MSDSEAVAINLRCSECGQGMKILVTDETDRNKPSICPFCGYDTLAPAQAKIFTQDARCFTPGSGFADFDPTLVKVLYNEWRLWAARETPGIKLPMRFVDFVAAKLAELDD